MTTRDIRLPSLFAGLTEAERDAFVARADLRELPPQTIVFRQGEAAESIFLVRTGRVALVCTSTEGRHIVLRFLGPGDAFGIAGLVREAEEVASALTLAPTTVYCWHGSTARSAPTYDLLLQNGLRMAVQYLKEYGERHLSLLAETAEERLARTLVHLVDTAGRVLATGVEVEISNADLAALSDVGMFTTSRQLKRWEREGHLVKRRHRVLVRNPKALMTKP